MKKIIEIFFLLFPVFLSTVSCMDEKVRAEWKFKEPVPAIVPGDRPADRMCWELYRKYDLHVYWNISGNDALMTENGIISSEEEFTANPNAFPPEAAEEKTAEKFLFLMTAFYDALPPELSTASLNKRHVLCKYNAIDFVGKYAMYNRMKNDAGESCGWFNGTFFDERSTVYYGYLDTPKDKKGDRFENNGYHWKWNICYEFFRGQASSFKHCPPAKSFGAVSKGYYWNYYDEDIIVPEEELCVDDIHNRYHETIGYTHGFVHFWGSLSHASDSHEDWGSYAAWILMTPLEERQEILETYSRVRTKYGIITTWYKDRYGLDLEKFGEQWRNTDVE